MMPNFWRRYSNCVFGKGLVKISAICSIEGIQFNWTTMCVTYSLKKWYLIGMCLDLEWRTIFLDILMALVLSQWRGMGSTNFTSKSASVWIIQSIYVQQVAATIIRGNLGSKMGLKTKKVLSKSTFKEPIAF